MTSTTPASTDRWTVTTRSQGGVQSALMSLPSVEMALLGIPEGFTASEIQSWLRDLAGVAIETSRTDERARPIPQLLHHVLTGLLFSQTELWSHTGQALPCAAVFVETPQGTAFGWVGRARVVLLVNGEPYEPQWVIVRDESGQEALSAVLPPQSHVLLTLEYWPEGESGQQAPASVDAECGQSFVGRPPIPMSAPRPIVTSGSTSPPGKSPMPATPLPASHRPVPVTTTPVDARLPVAGGSAAAALPPTEQPGLAPDPSMPLRLDQPDVAQQVPSTYHPSSATFSMPAVPGGAAAGEASAAATRPEPARASGEPGMPHPVGRWLNKIMDFAKKAIPAQEMETGARNLASGLKELATRATPPVISPALGSTERANVAAATPRPIAPAAPVLRSPGSAAAPSPAPAPVKPDVHELHALHALGGPAATPAPSVPPLSPSSVAPPESAAAASATPSGTYVPGKSSLLAVGLSDILGSRASVSPAKPQTSATRGAGSEPVLPAAKLPGHREPAGGDGVEAQQPPYPVLEVKPPRPVATPRGPIQIEREPVGASSEFAIPKLPPREAPKPFKVPLPTAADMVKPAAPATGGKVAPPATSLPPPTPSAAHSSVPGAVRRVEVPEPPADFLAEFAASLSADIQDDPPPPPSSPVVEVRRPVPPLPSVMRAVANVASATPAAPAPAQSIAPLPAPVPQPVEPEPPTAPPVLKAPTEEAPISVSQSELPVILRELPLPQKGGDAGDNEPPDGMLVATPMRPRARRGEWPALDELEAEAQRPLWKNPWLVGAIVAVLFGVGWVVGHSQAPDNDIHSTPMSRMLRAVGLSGARFTATVDSDPPGAIISVDGKEVGRRTPATIELVPGDHKITLSMPDLGQVEVDVKGSRGQQVKVSESLHGSLEVTALDKSVPVKVSLDGQAMGFLPLSVSKLPPGLHEVQFSGPNMQPWAQNVSVPIRGTATVRARPMMSPATGVLQVQAILNDEGGSTPLSGASVFVDGELRGSTPETMELPRGPHSIKVTYRGTSAPVQVIDLPGGNRRFSQFHFGLESDLPPLKLRGDYSSLPAKKETLVEASLDGLDWHDVREAWLHVRTSDGLWRRYQVTIEEGLRGTALSAMFPQNVADAGGRVHWYMSAATTQGDDFYTEMQRSTR